MTGGYINYFVYSMCNKHNRICLRADWMIDHISILLYFFHGAPSCPAIRKSEGAVSEALVWISIRLTRCS